MQLRQAMVADKLTAGELMCTSLVALPPVVPLRQLCAALRGCRHASFPVTEDPAAAAQPGQVAVPLQNCSCQVMFGKLLEACGTLFLLVHEPLGVAQHAPDACPAR
jgi:hypothetical protein